MEWKWTKGEPYERSRRLKHVQELENKEFSKNMETSAYTSSLHHDENTWDILNQSLNNSTPFVKISSKREDLDTKIADRGLTQQIGFNPFLGENSYINDVAVRDQFLKPINTTQGEMRSKEYN
jgi:hypothetical protein